MTNNNIQRIKKHTEGLLKELTNCNSEYKLYKLILQKTNDNLDELNIAPAFFGLTLKALINDIIMTLAKIYEKPCKTNSSIYKLLNKVQQDIKRINHDDINNNIIKQHIQELEECSDILNNLFTWRDKHFAHFDKKYFLTNNAVSNDAKLTYGNIEKIINSAGDVLNYYYSKLEGKYMSIEATNYDDLNRIVRILKYYNENKHDICLNILNKNK